LRKRFVTSSLVISARIVQAQLRAAPHAKLFIAKHSDHATLTRDPGDDMIEALVKFLAKCASDRGNGDPI
jgi:hypothetical protein